MRYDHEIVFVKNRGVSRETLSTPYDKIEPRRTNATRQRARLVRLPAWHGEAALGKRIVPAPDNTRDGTAVWCADDVGNGWLEWVRG